MRLISEGFGRDPLAAGASRSVSPSRMSLHSLTHSLQMYTDGPETSRATSSWPRPQNEQRIGCGVAMRFFMRVRSSSTGRRRHGPRGPGRSASLLTGILAKHTGRPIDQIVKDTDRNHWLTAEEAKGYGLVDEIIEKRR